MRKWQIILLGLATLAATSIMLISIAQFLLPSEGTAELMPSVEQTIAEGRKSETNLNLPQTPPYPEPRSIEVKGIVESRWSPNPRQFTIQNSWLGDKFVIAAGSLTADPTQGVIIIRPRGETHLIVETYVTGSKEGPLTIVGSHGEDVEVTSEKGTLYKIDVSAISATPSKMERRDPVSIPQKI